MSVLRHKELAGESAEAGALPRHRRPPQHPLDGAGHAPTVREHELSQPQGSHRLRNDL